jgi:nitrogen fixation protein FixH
MIARSRRGSWIPWAFAAAFAVVIAVNAALAAFAVRSAPGTVSAHPYEDGLGYNGVLALAEAQDRLGWSIEAGLTRHPPPLAEEGKTYGSEIRISVRDRAGTPIIGADVAGRLVRPLGPARAVPVTAREVEPGLYTAAAEFTAGQWDMELVVRRGAERFAATIRVAAR